MKIIIKQPGEHVQLKEIDKISLEYLDKQVDGEIGLVYPKNYVKVFRNTKYVFVIDDEGMIKAKPLNFVFPDTGTKIHGPVIAMKLNNSGGLIGLDNKDVNKITEYLEEITYGKRTSESLV